MGAVPDGRSGGPRFDVIGFGEISVDEVIRLAAAPAWGGKAASRSWERLGGGQVATAMVACARLGLRAAVAGHVGDDEAGRFALDGLVAERVDVERVVRGRAATRRAVVLVGDDGARTVIGNDPAVSVPPLDEAALRDTRVLHVDATCLGSATASARLARSHGVTVSCDLDALVADAQHELLGCVDLAIVSADFLGPRDGTFDVERELRRLHGMQPRGGVAVVTLGERGAAGFDGRSLVEEAALPCPRAVDTTACGDTFRAGFLAAWLDGRELRACLRFANAAAALKTRDLGRRGCPTRAEVERTIGRSA